MGNYVGLGVQPAAPSCIALTSTLIATLTRDFKHNTLCLSYYILLLLFIYQEYGYTTVNRVDNEKSYVVQ